MKKAYLVWGDDVDYGGVEFISEEGINDPDEIDDPAFRGPTYRTIEEYLDDNYENWRRVPDLDAFAERGSVPVGYLIQFHDWWQECSWCSTRVDSDEYDYYGDRELNPVYRDQQVFCCPGCEKAYDADVAFRRDRLEEAKRYVKGRWPFVECIRSSFSTGPIKLRLDATGLTNWAEWSSDDPTHVTVFGQEDFEVWRSLVKGLTDLG